MNLSDNQVKSERLLCVIQSISSLTKATQAEAFRMSQYRKKGFSSLYEIAPEEGKKKRSKEKVIRRRQPDSPGALILRV